MVDLSKNIIDFIDDNLSKKDTNILQQELKNNPTIKKDYVLFKELNSYMKTKLLIDSFENEVNYFVVEEQAKKDIADFIIEGKNDKEVLNYLSIAFPNKDIELINKINDIEIEINELGLEEITSSWLDEINIDKDKELSDFISSNDNLKSKDQSIKRISSKNIFNISRRKIFLYATSAAAVLLIAFMIKASFFTLNKNEIIFSNYHNKPQELYTIGIRGNDSKLVETFNSASELYKQEKYNEAYILFNNIAEDNSTFAQAMFYSGLAKFEAGDYKKSNQIFSKLISKFDIFNLEANWFIALSYIKMNDYKNAIPYLNDLTKQKSIYQNKAKEIIEIIND